MSKLISPLSTFKLKHCFLPTNITWYLLTTFYWYFLILLLYELTDTIHIWTWSLYLIFLFLYLFFGNLLNNFLWYGGFLNSRRIINYSRFLNLRIQLYHVFKGNFKGISLVYFLNISVALLPRYLFYNIFEVKLIYLIKFIY
jgi:hypothetical protein